MAQGPLLTQLRIVALVDFQDITVFEVIKSYRCKILEVVIIRQKTKLRVE